MVDALGSSVPGAWSRLKRRNALSKLVPGRPVRRALAMSNQAGSSQRETRGRREREADSEEAGGAILKASQSRRWKAFRSSRRWRPSRGTTTTKVSVGPTLRRGLLPSRRPHRRRRNVPRAPRRGTSFACADQAHATCTASEARQVRTRPSLGSRTRARRSSLTPTAQRRLEVTRWRRYRGWENLLTRGRTNTGAGTIGRRAARRAPQHPRKHRGASEPEGDCGPRPSEEFESPGRAPARRKQLLQKSIGGVWPRIRSRAALQKEWRRE